MREEVCQRADVDGTQVLLCLTQAAHLQCIAGPGGMSDPQEQERMNDMVLDTL
jgi:hypothetical protein